jgi:hypothetical protein
MLAATRVPYCGLPPVPGLTIWNLDPILLVCLAVCALAYFIPFAKGSRQPSWAGALRFHSWSGCPVPHFIYRRCAI